MLIKISNLKTSNSLLRVLPWDEMRLPTTITSSEIKYYKFQAEQMVEICLEQNGIGLSANQVGINRTFFVMQINSEYFSAFFNPSWKPVESNLTDIDKEGCLSAPDQIYLVERPKTIQASWWGLDEKNKPKFFTDRLTGLLARCFMHETDHLLLKTIADVGSLVT